MQIKLHLMGSLKQKFISGDCPEQNCHMEVNEKATPRALLRLFGIDEDNILAMINGKPVDLDELFHDGDRVVLMNPHSKEA